ncbi:MAG TPA: hypothetical protein VKA44_06390, partial [Gemmatimonadota bacterium]|nr:hypothetical protein [Gemmatimonadota bacterium]
LVHDDGVPVDGLTAIYGHSRSHDPRDLDFARRLAGEDGQEGTPIRLGLFYRDESRPRYDEVRRVPARTAAERVELLEKELDRHAI